MVAVDAKETNPDGGGMVAPGTYLWAVNDITTGEDNIAVECVVVAGVTADPREESQNGRKQTEYLKIFGKGASRLLQWACAVGLITKEEWKKAKDTQEPIEFDETQAVGRYFGAGIESKLYAGQNEDHKGKHFPSMDFRIWPITDPKMIDVIKKPDAKKVLGAMADEILKSHGDLANGNQAKTPDATKKPNGKKDDEPPAAAAVSADPFGEF